MLQRNTISDAAARLKVAIHDRTAVVGIVGLGYVGIPLALTAAKAGFNVLGFDIDAPRVDQINLGKSLIKHISSEAVSEAVDSGKFQ
uniref:NAD(P)-binding domain-containing protein n=1 Tax=Microvirga sp. G4-2 TaxID=3434467 RepID=UPI004044A521